MISRTWRLNIASMLFFMLIQVVVPLVPRYALTIGASPFEIGLAVSSVSITAIFLRPLSGFVSDRQSRSKMMVLGLFLGSSSYLLLSASEGILPVFAARLIEGAAIASFIPSSLASAVDEAKDGKIGEALGWRSLMVGIGFTAGPALGGFLSEAFSYRTTFLITALLMLTLVPAVVYKDAKRPPPSRVSTLRGLRERDFGIAFSSLVIYAVAWMGLLTFLSAYLKLMGFGDLEIGLFLSVQAIGSLGIRVIGGRMADRYPDTMTFSGLSVIGLALFLVYLNPTPPWIYAAAAVFGPGVGLFVPGSQTLALKRSSPSSRGFLSSIYTMGMDIGNLVGPLVFGLIVQSGGYRASFAVAPVLMIVAALAVAIPFKIMKSRPGAAS